MSLGPAALVRSLPAALGATPVDEVVLVGVSSMAPTAATVGRVDLSGVTSPTDDAAAEIGDAVVAAARAAVADGATKVAILAYAEDADRPDSIAARSAATAVVAAELEGLGVLDAIAVFRGRWRSYECTNPSCCPPDGTPIPTPEETRQ